MFRPATAAVRTLHDVEPDCPIWSRTAGTPSAVDRRLATGIIPAMARLSKAEQDEVVLQLVLGMETMDGDEWDELRGRLDDEHQRQVADAAREFADDAVGTEHWDSDR